MCVAERLSDIPIRVAHTLELLIWVIIWQLRSVKHCLKQVRISDRVLPAVSKSLKDGRDGKKFKRIRSAKVMAILFGAPDGVIVTQFDAKRVTLLVENDQGRIVGIAS